MNRRRTLTTRTRWLVAAVATVLAVGATAGIIVTTSGIGGPAPTTVTDSPAAGPRALTTAEAERLAVARFLAYQDGSRTFRTEVVAEGAAITLHGRVDHRAHIGIAAATTADDAAVVTWNDAVFAGWPAPGAPDAVPTEIPSAATTARPLDPSASAVDTTLALLLSLGTDRPDNAQLLQQSDAAWLRADEIGGVAVDVIAGPSDADGNGSGGTTRYWIDERGALLRFEADLPSGAVVVDLEAEQYVAVPRAPQLG